MKILEAVKQDENNKWILLMGVLQIMACVIMYWVNISNPNIIYLSYCQRFWCSLAIRRGSFAGALHLYIPCFSFP